MNYRYGYLALVVVAVLLLVAPGCNSRGVGVAGTPTTVNITLAFNNCSSGSCTCTQNGNASPVQVSAGNVVQYTFPSAANSTITFTATPGSPFNTVTGINSATSQSGTIPSAPSGTQWNYASVTSGTNSCGNPGQLGIIMR